jgi:hypothetical protein
MIDWVRSKLHSIWIGLDRIAKATKRGIVRGQGRGMWDKYAPCSHKTTLVVRTAPYKRLADDARCCTRGLSGWLWTWILLMGGELASNRLLHPFLLLRSEFVSSRLLHPFLLLSTHLVCLSGIWRRRTRSLQQSW